MRWTLEWGGPPAIVRQDGEIFLILRTGLGEKEKSLQPISWDEFKDIFESRKLQFLYQEHVRSGAMSRLCKLGAR